MKIKAVRVIVEDKNGTHDAAIPFDAFMLHFYQGQKYQLGHEPPEYIEEIKKKYPLPTTAKKGE